MPLFARIPPTHRIATLALPGVVAFDLSVPAQVFGHPTERSRYALSVCAPEPGPVPTSTGFSIVADRGLDAIAEADTVIVPGVWRTGDSVDGRALDALRAADARGARMVSICTGAFVLAAAGVLDGRRAATHWYDAPALARAFPRVDVDADVLYVDEGRVLTSAGVAAGIDLCLHIVRLDHGAEHANRVARRIVVAPHRSGGQAQFVDRPLPGDEGRSLEPTRAWALDRLDEPLTVRRLAAHALVSERSFLRRFRAETGTSPLRWIHAQRVALARRLLEETDLPVEHVASRCGFGTAASLREHFRRATQTTPTAYRRAFRGR
jgi:transcriptional regulator GlxA family with amidase domain